MGYVGLGPTNLATSSGTFTAVSGGTLGLAGVVSSGKFAPQSLGTVVLSGTYSGPLANLVPASGGILVLNDNTTSGTLNIAGGGYYASSPGAFGPATLALSGGSLGATTALTGSNAVPAALVWGSSRTLNISGPAAVQLSSSLALSSGSYGINDPAGLSILSGVISGSGGLVYDNLGTASGFNTYTGGTTLPVGSNPTITNRGAFGASLNPGSGALTFNGGGFTASQPLTGELAVPNPWGFNGSATAHINGTNAVELSGNAALPVGAVGAIIVVNPANSLTLSGVISGSGALETVYNGANNENGTLIINGQNTFSGGFFLNSNTGILDLRSSTVLSGTQIVSGPLGKGTFTNGSNNNGWIGVANNGGAAVTIANPMTINGNTGFSSAVGLTWSGPITLAQNNPINLYDGGTVSLTGPIGGGEALNLEQGGNWGAGGTTIGGPVASTYTGATSITQGTLILAANAPASGAGGLGNASSAVVLGNAAGGANDGTIGFLIGGSYTMARPITVNNFGNGTYLGGNTNNNSTFSGAITLAESVTIVSAATGNNAVTFSGAISNGGTGFGVNVLGPGNVVFAASNTYSGVTAVNAGVLALAFSQAMSPASNIVASSSPLSLGGGVLALLGSSGVTNNQTFNGTTVNPGSSTVALVPNGGGTTNLNLGTVTRNAGGTVDFNVLGNGAITISPPGTANTILSDANGVAYGTFGGSDWAAVAGDGVTITAGSNVSGFYTASTAGGSEFVAGNNVDVSSGVNTQLRLGPSTITIASLHFNQSPASTIDVYGNSLTTGGILVTPNDGGSSIVDGFGGGTLQGPASGDLVVIQNSANPFTIQAVIAGGGLTKAGSGLLVLNPNNGANTFTGPTTVSGGTLQGPVGSLPTAVTLTNKATLAIDDQGGNVTFNPSITGNGGLVKIGGGVLNTSSVNPQNFSGPTVITAGTLRLSPISVSVSNLPSSLNAWFEASALTYTNGQNVATWPDESGQGHNATFNGTGNMTFTTDQVNGLPVVEFRNSGTATISGTLFSAEQYIVLRNPNGGNTFDQWGAAMGDVDNQQGYMMGSDNNNTSAWWNNNRPAAVAVDGAPLATNAVINAMSNQQFVVLKVDGNYTSQAALDYWLGSVYGNGSNQYKNMRLDVAEILSFSSDLTAAQQNEVGGYLAAKYDIGTSYATTYFSTTSPVIVDATATFDVNGNVQTIASLSGAIGSFVTLGSGQLTIGGDNTNTTFAGSISGAGGSLTKVGNGTMTVSAASGINVPTTITAGAVCIADPNALLNCMATVNVDYGLTFAVNTANLGGLAGTGNIVMADGTSPVTLSVGGENANSTYSGVLSDGVGGVSAGSSLVKTGSGTLLLRGRNTYSGPTMVDGGVLQTNDGGGLPAASPLTLNGGILQSDGPAIFTRTLSAVATAPGSFAMNGASGFAANGGHFTVSLNPGGGQPVGVYGPIGAQLVWANDPIVFGSPTANNVVELTNPIDLHGQSATVAVNSGAGGDSALLSGNITDSTAATTTGVIKTGGGLLSLSGNNVFGGGVTINQGTVQMASANALGSASTSVYFVDGNATDLQLNGNNLTLSNLIVDSSGGTAAMIENGNANPAPVTLTLNSANDMTFDGTIQNGAGAGALSIVKLATNTVTLGGANTYSGGTTLSAGGLSLGSNTALGTGALNIYGGTLSAATTVVAGNALNVNASFTIGGGNDLTIGGGVNLGGSLRTITVNNTGSTTLSGSISNGGLVKMGPGLLNLTAYNSTYAGGTTVSQGTLSAPGSGPTSGGLGTGPLTLAGGTFVIPVAGAAGLTMECYHSQFTYDFSNNQGTFQPSFASLGALNALTSSLGTPDYTALTTYSAPSYAARTTLNWPNTGEGQCFLSSGFDPTKYPCAALTAEGVGQTRCYMIRFDGVIDIPTTGNYTFGTNSDDGSMVYIDGNVVVNNNNFQGWTGNDAPTSNQQTGTVNNLTAGYHSITLAYYEGTGGEAAVFNWDQGTGNWAYLSNSVLATGASPQYNNAVFVTNDSTIYLPTSNGVACTFPSLSIGADTLTVTGGTTGSSVTISGATTITGTAGTATFNVDVNTPLTLAAAISDTGNLAITKSGSGTLILAASGSTFSSPTSAPLNVLGGTVILGADGSNFTGNVLVSNGVVQLSYSTALVNSTVTVNSDFGLQFNTGLLAATIGGLGGSGNVVLNTLMAEPVTLTVGGNGQNTTYSGAMGGNGSLVKTGSGTLTMTSTANNYAGSLTIDNGVLEVNNLSNSNGANGPNGGLITLGGSGPATLRFIGSNDSVGRPINLGNNGTLDASETSDPELDNLYFYGPITASSAYNLTLSGTSAVGGEIDNTMNLSGGSLIKNGSGLWLLDSHPNVIAGTIVNAGTLVIDQDSTGSGAVVLNGGTLASVSYQPVTLGGALLAGSGAHTIQPGGSGQIGILNVPGMTLNRFSSLDFDITSTSSLDQINDAGNLSFSGNGAANIVVPSGLPTGTYELMTYSPTSSISLNDFSLGLLSGGSAPANYQLELASGKLELLRGHVGGGVQRLGYLDFYGRRHVEQRRQLDRWQRPPRSPGPERIASPRRGDFFVHCKHGQPDRSDGRGPRPQGPEFQRRQLCAQRRQPDAGR